jgi:hypothetical protein
VVVILDWFQSPQVKTICVGIGLNLVDILIKYIAVQRCWIGHEHIDTEVASVGAYLRHLLDEHLGCFVATGEQSEAAGLGGGDNELRGGGPSGHRCSKDGVGQIQVSKRRSHVSDGRPLGTNREMPVLAGPCSWDMDAEFHYLRAFIAVAQSKSFTRAVEQPMITQPAL